MKCIIWGLYSGCIKMSCYTIALVHRIRSGELSEVQEFVRMILAHHGFMINYFHESPKVVQDGVGREFVHLVMDVMIENPGEGHQQHMKKYSLPTSMDMFLDRARTAAMAIRTMTTYADAELVYEATGMAYNHNLIKPCRIIYTDTEDCLMLEPVKYWVVKLVRPPLPKKSKSWTPIAKENTVAKVR
jgi:hypothetical protein